MWIANHTIVSYQLNIERWKWNIVSFDLVAFAPLVFGCVNYMRIPNVSSIRMRCHIKMVWVFVCVLLDAVAVLSEHKIKKISGQTHRWMNMNASEMQYPFVVRWQIEGNRLLWSYKFRFHIFCLFLCETRLLMNILLFISESFHVVQPVNEIRKIHLYFV